MGVRGEATTPPPGVWQEFKGKKNVFSGQIDSQGAQGSLLRAKRPSGALGSHQTPPFRPQVRTFRANSCLPHWRDLVPYAYVEERTET